MSERTVSVEIVVDTSGLSAAFAKVAKQVARLAILTWQQRPDPNPFPHFHLFRRSPQS